MKRLICKILVLAIIVTTLPLAASCGNGNQENEKLKYYQADGIPTQFDDEELIKRYNIYCQNNYDESYQIEVVKFENEEDMYTKMSAELMAGQGPDIFTLDQTLPFEKLIKSYAFADINELIANDTSKNKLDLSEYNQAMIKAGEYNGKLYIIPAFYHLNTLISTDNVLNEYDLPLENGMTLTYADIPQMFEKYLSDKNKRYFMYSYAFSFLNSQQQLLDSFIYSYVDFENGNTYFDSEEFSKGLDSIMQLTDCFEEPDEDTYENYLFDLYTGGNLEFLARANYQDEKNGNKRIFYNGFNRNAEDISATIELGVAINANSKHKDKALAFLKYLLSYDFQVFYCGDKEGSDYIGTNMISHPVNIDAFEHSIKASSSFTYWEEYEKDGVWEYDEYEVNGTDNEYMQEYIKSIRGINKCKPYYNVSESYFCKNVVGDIVDDYINGKLTKAKFIQQITSAVRIYISE